MKNILDKIDQSPIWLKLSIVFVLAIILATGLFLVNKQREEMIATIPSTSQSSEALNIKDSTDRNADNDQAQIIKEAEEAVKKLETEQIAEDIAPAQEKVAKVKELTTRVKFQQRMKVIADILTAQTGVYYDIEVESLAAAAAQQDATAPTNQTPISSGNSDTVSEVTINSGASAGIE